MLDNCEHLVGAAARFARDLLSTCEGLTVLATSREPLRVSGEIVWPVPTLSLPDPASSHTVEDLLASEAVRLVVDRARSRLPTFDLTDKNAGAVASVCRELDGIPLAIELSTARMGALAVEQIVERLEGSLKLLSGGDRTVAERHQTLRATLDWSYDLLGDPERVLFRRLSVFAGGWPLEAAEDVGSGGGIEAGDILDLLSRLVDKSMVIVEQADGRALRYGMLEPVRRYGEGLLEASGESQTIRRAHGPGRVTILAVTFLAAICLATLALVASAQASGRAPTTLTIRADGLDLSGKVKSPRLGCLGGRNIKLYKQVGAVQNPSADKLIVTDTSERVDG